MLALRALLGALGRAPGTLGLALALAPVAASAQIDQAHFTAMIDNAQEQAAGNCPAGSTARGIGTFTLEGGSVLSYSVTFGNNAPSFSNGLLDQGAENGAHLHVGAVGVSGGIAEPLPLGSPKSGVTALLSPAEITALQAGRLYINIHSTGCGSGEIRGQLLPSVPALNPAALLGLATLLAGAGALVAGRLRARA